MKRQPATIPPYILNVYKPAGMSSQDVVRHFKYSLPRGYGKIGHFGTLDPFAEGVLMIGVAGAARLNEFIHSELPKTYIAYGKLGVETDTGDLTEGTKQLDESEYLHTVISQFEPSFIEEQLREEFLGEYWQAPHKYSAAKHEGRNLHEWARDGIEIKKEKKKKNVYDLRVLNYNFPDLEIEYTVSSGTYIRTLFSECAQKLGTLGALDRLKRTQVGQVNSREALTKEDWPIKNDEWSYQASGVYNPWDVLNFQQLKLNESESRAFLNGNPVNREGFGQYCWVFDQANLIGMAEYKKAAYWPKIVWANKLNLGSHETNSDV